MNPLAYPKLITLDSLDDLFAHHRDRFGGWRMEDDGDGADDKKADDKGKDYTPPASQADLDRIIQDRVARERDKYVDYSDLKKAKGEYDKLLEAAKTDQEKAVEAAKNEGRTEALTAANTRLLSAEARALAAEAKFASPALVVRALDLSDVKVNDDGSVDGDAIKAKLKEAAESGAFVIGDGKKAPPRPDRTQGRDGDDKPSVARGQQLWEDRHKKKTPA